MEKIIYSIKNAILNQGISESEAARRAELDQRTVNRLLSGLTKKPDINAVFALMQALGISQSRPIDIYEMAGAGDPQLSSGEVVISVTLPTDFTKSGIVPVFVKGDSMNPILLNGAIVGVDTNDKNVISGKMYAVWLDDEGAQIKTLIKGFDKVTVKSENPLAPTVDFPKEVLRDHFVLGRVRWWINQDMEGV